jgi:hypothetical protein
MSSAAIRYTVRALVLEGVVWLCSEVPVQPTRAQRTNFENFDLGRGLAAGQLSKLRTSLHIRLSEIEFVARCLPSVNVKPVAGTMDQRKEPPFA